MLALTVDRQRDEDIQKTQFLGFSLLRTVRLGWLMEGLNGKEMCEDFSQKCVETEQN
jgi:hypothetical protein